MNRPIREEVSIDRIDLADTRLKFRKAFSEDARKKRASSIEVVGLLNPIKLWKEGDHYSIIAGWQRIDAMKSLNHATILADIYENITFEEALQINIDDNNLRENLTDYELALQMQTLKKELHYTVSKIAEMFRCDTDRVYDLLSIFDMDEELRSAVEREDLKLYPAVIIKRFPVSERSEILRRTIEEGRSVKWLRGELSQTINHPFYESYTQGKAALPGEQHALRFPRTPEVEKVWRGYWETMAKGFGVPSPLKCEFTMTRPALSSIPPYVCHNDIEWVVLAQGSLILPNAKVGRRWNDIPLEKRDGWFFLCDRCTRLMFPGITLHHDLFFTNMRACHQQLDEDS